MSNNIEKLLAISVAPTQDLENALRQLELYRFVDTAEGDQLDIIGRLVGQDRDGMDDDDYRRYIRARIAANKSNGTVEDLLTVAFLVIYDADATYLLAQEGDATARLRIADIAVTDDLGEILGAFIEDTRAAGVRIVVQWAVSEPALVFQFDDGPGLDQGFLSTSVD